MSDGVQQKLLPATELATGTEGIDQLLPCIKGGFGQARISQEREGPFH